MKTWDEITNQTSNLQNLVNKLYQRHNALLNFFDAGEWDKTAQESIGLLQSFQNEINGYLKEQVSAYEELKQERNQTSFFKKVFSSRSIENEIKENIQKAEIEIRSYVTLIDELYEMMDKTPVSKSEQKEIADGLRQIKKDLTLQKREINEDLRQTRANARQKTTQWTGVNSGVLGSIARHQRITARLEKERSLIPLEDQKALIEKELITIEKDLNWVLHFRDNGSNNPPQIPQTNINFEKTQSCPYCGRKATTDVCLSCGATIPIIE